MHICIVYTRIPVASQRDQSRGRILLRGSLTRSYAAWIEEAASHIHENFGINTENGRKKVPGLFIHGTESLCGTVTLFHHILRPLGVIIEIFRIVAYRPCSVYLIFPRVPECRSNVADDTRHSYGDWWKLSAILCSILYAAFFHCCKCLWNVRVNFRGLSKDIAQHPG